MYYRRKILLALLQSFGDKLEKLALQKLLFLFSQEQGNPNYYFVPYKYGCYSFQANADLTTMCKYGLVEENSITWIKTDLLDYFNMLLPEDQKILTKIYNKFKDYNTDSLIKYTYKKFPYFAINSEIAKAKLTKSELNKVKKHQSIKNQKVLFTIGYEGISVEQYFNKLIQNNIKVLCDVRNFPRSMKYGFSKNQLKNSCNSLGIDYVHLPNLGIIPKKRKNLISQKDYDLLFKEYKREVLNNNQEDQLIILDLLNKNKRVALTCFEGNIHQCHRFHLSKNLTTFNDWNYNIKHI